MAAKKDPANKVKFNPEDAKIILELGKQGASQKAMYAAIGISKDVAARLKKEDPFFAETMSLATTYGQAYFENLLLANIENKNFNSRVAELALRGQYPEDYRETRNDKLEVKQDIKIDFGKEVADLIKALKE